MNLVVAGGIGAAALVGGLWYKKKNSTEEAKDIDLEFKDNSNKKKEQKAKVKAQKEELQKQKDALKKEKKLEKERARKAAKKEQKEKERLEAEAAAEAAAVAKPEEEAPATTGGKKKKKKKNKKNKDAAPAVTSAAEPEPEVVEEVEAAWTEIKVSSKKKKQTEVAVIEDPAVVKELYVSNDKFGVVIGPGGSTLKAIQEATGTKIDMPKAGGMRRDIVISGNAENDVNTAMRAIKELVSKGYSSITHAGTTDDVITVKSAREIGIIVGPGGKYIKMIQEATSTKINTPDRESSDLNVSIVGPSDGVRAAMHAMKQLIKDGYSSITHPNQSVSEVLVPRSMLGTLIGPGGITIKKLQEETKCRVDISDSKQDIITVKILGEPTDVVSCRHALTQLTTLPDPEPVPNEWTKEASAMTMSMVW